MLRRLAYALIPAVHRAGNTGPCTRWPNRLRRWLLPALDPASRRLWNRPLTRDKSGADAEHVATIMADLCEFERALSSSGFERSVVSTLKYVNGTNESAAWAYHDGEWQTHVYIFEFGMDLHVYAHREPSYLTNPEAHEGGAQQTPGDPEGRLGPVFDALG